MRMHISQLVVWAIGLFFAVVTAPVYGGLIYFNDFEAPLGAEWSSTLRDTTPLGARTFLGQFGNDTVTLTLTGLPEHASINLSFDLFIIRTWDARTQPAAGPDRWGLAVAGGPVLLDTTFSNTFRPQDYPDAFDTASNAARTGAVENNTLGFVWSDDGQTYDSVYHPNFSFTHTNSTLTLQFSASGLQELDNESWGLDNVSVQADLSSVPEPASLLVWSALGLAGAAGCWRRKRKT
jgi:hypothetical protein